MDTFLYTSDIDGIHNRINLILHGTQTNILSTSIDNNTDINIDFDVAIGNSGDGNSINTNSVVKDEIYNDGDGEDILKKKYEQMSAVEMRTCEMEMFKYKQMLAQHKYERGFRKKASVLEREMNSKTKVKECNSLTDFAKALDVSHSKWMRCAKKTKEKYIKEFVYRKYGIPIEKKSRKGPGGSKKGKTSAFNVASINLNTCEPGAEPNICVKSTGKSDGGAKKTPTDTKTKTKKEKPEITEEMTKELEKYLQNLNDDVYDDPENITYDHKKKRIEELAL
jgi:hypothetical protein